MVISKKENFFKILKISLKIKYLVNEGCFHKYICDNELMIFTERVYLMFQNCLLKIALKPPEIFQEIFRVIKKSAYKFIIKIH